MGKRKLQRPFDPRKSIHLVLRSTMAKGQYSSLAPANQAWINAYLQQLTKKYSIRVYEWANVGNHLHLLVRAKTRNSLQNFLRVFAGRIAQKITGAKKGKPLGRRFWDLLTFSRVVSWGNAFNRAKAYVIQNAHEAMNLIPPRPRIRISRNKNIGRPSATCSGPLRP